MEEEKEVLSKKKVIKICLMIFFGVIAFSLIVALIGTNGKLFSMEGSDVMIKVFLWISLGFLIVVSLIGFFSYKYHNKHPEMYKELNKPRGQKGVGIFIILFGAYLILQGGYAYFIEGLNSSLEIKAILIRVGIGISALIWGTYLIRKNRLKKNGRRK